MNELKVPPQEQLLAFIEQEERRLVGRSFDVPGQNLREFEAVYGVCAQAIRHAGAYVVLVRAGRSREAVALARQAVEYAGTAVWAHFIDGGLERLIATIEATHFDFFRKMSVFLGDPDLLREVEALEAEMEARGKGMPRIVERLAAIDQHAMLQTIYMQQSQLMHVTGSSILAFLSVDRDGELGLNFDPPDPHGVNTAYATAMATMFAAWQIAFAGGDSATLTELDRLSDELLLPLSADPDDAQTQKSDQRVS